MTVPQKDNEGYSYFAKELAPLFQHHGVDLLQFILCFLRLQDPKKQGWDSLVESRQILEDLIALNKADLGALNLDNAEKTHLRLHLLSYVQLVEMNAPYVVLANLLRIKCGLNYSANPFRESDTTILSKRPVAQDKIKKATKKTLPSAQSKIGEINFLAHKSKLPTIGSLFDEFYIQPLRNAIAHADYVLTSEEIRLVGHQIRVKNNPHLYTSILSIEDLGNLLGLAYDFYTAFFILESWAREQLAALAGNPIYLDAKYKTILEISANKAGLIDGFVLHWPNGRECFYLPGTDSPRIKNLGLNESGEIIFLAGKEFKAHDFSPLIVKAGTPKYSPSHFTQARLTWPRS